MAARSGSSRAPWAPQAAIPETLVPQHTSGVRTRDTLEGARVPGVACSGREEKSLLIPNHSGVAGGPEVVLCQQHSKKEGLASLPRFPRTEDSAGKGQAHGPRHAHTCTRGVWERPWPCCYRSPFKGAELRN